MTLVAALFLVARRTKVKTSKIAAIFRQDNLAGNVFVVKLVIFDFPFTV